MNKSVGGEAYSYILTKTSMERKSPRPYWLFVTAVANILGITKGRAHEAASHVRPDCMEKKEFKEYSFALKEWRRRRGEEPYLPRA